VSPLSFAHTVIGRWVQAPGGIGGECVDLANLYLAACRGLGPVRRNAVDWATLTLPNMAWVANTPTNFPSVGSIVVWNEYTAEVIGLYGHIAVCMAADQFHMVTLDQNWPVGADVALVLHDYGGVLGWHTPR
jgi:hypothetical protein